MLGLQKNGFRSKHLVTDITLGITDGLDMSLWCYVFASIIFSGALSVFLPVGILVCLLGWVLVSLSIALLSKEPLHIANLDDQAVVIRGACSAQDHSAAYCSIPGSPLPRNRHPATTSQRWS